MGCCMQRIGCGERRTDEICIFRSAFHILMVSLLYSLPSPELVSSHFNIHLYVVGI